MCLTHASICVVEQIPRSLTKANGYEREVAVFGRIPYGKSIQQPVYYVNASLCEIDLPKIDNDGLDLS